MFYSLLSKLTASNRRSRDQRGNATSARRRRANRPLRLEPLEDRQLLSTMTSTAVQAYPSTSQYGQPVTLAAKVTTTPASPRGGGPTGTVTFYLNNASSTPLGTANVTQLGTAVLYNESAPLPIGAKDTILAVYSGDSNFSGSQGSVIETVNPAMTRTVVYASSHRGTVGVEVTFTAVVTGTAPGWANNGGYTPPPTGTLSFTVNGATVPSSSVILVASSGDSAIYTYTVSVSSLTQGVNTVIATYDGDSNYLASTSRILAYRLSAYAARGSAQSSVSRPPASP